MCRWGCAERSEVSREVCLLKARSWRLSASCLVMEVLARALPCSLRSQGLPSGVPPAWLQNFKHRKLEATLNRFHCGQPDCCLWKS